LADAPPALNEPVTDFSASMTSGGTFRLADYGGRRVVLYFYPKDNSPGCTTEALHFRDAYAQFEAADTGIFGVSRDSLRSHEGFRTKLDIPFELISDPEEVLCNQFGVMRIKSMYGKKVRGIERSTFVIDANGTLVKEWRGLQVPGHVDEVLAFVKTLASSMA
jgi:peroxiredoxin Q/BCP